ncbi:hypothetical protein ACFXG4_51035 [Nocardia sp. NPDC059246]|uniref:hypothetical protein n=1 Tax=unclassified Nocardia TaxID=2637762 RepID=UPI00369BDBBD
MDKPASIASSIYESRLFHGRAAADDASGAVPTASRKRVSWLLLLIGSAAVVVRRARGLRPAKPRWGHPAAEFAGPALWPAAVGEQFAQSCGQEAADTESITLSGRSRRQALEGVRRRVLDGYLPPHLRADRTTGTARVEARSVGRDGVWLTGHAGIGVVLTTDHEVAAVARSARSTQHSYLADAAQFGGDATTEGGTEMTVFENNVLVASGVDNGGGRGLAVVN